MDERIWGTVLIKVNTAFTFEMLVENGIGNASDFMDFDNPQVITDVTVVEAPN